MVVLQSGLYHTPAQTRAALPASCCYCKHLFPSSSFPNSLMKRAEATTPWCISNKIFLSCHPCLQIVNHFLYYMNVIIDYLNFSLPIYFGYSYLSFYLNTLVLQCSIILFQAFNFSFRDIYKVKKIIF